MVGRSKYYQCPSFCNKLTGCAGVLYPPHCLYKDVLNEDLFMKLAPTNDDQWFWLMGVLNNVRVCVVRNNERNLNYVPGSQETSLCQQNDGDAHLFWIQFQNMLDYYPTLMDKLMSDINKEHKIFYKERWDDGRRIIYFMGCL